MNSPHNRQTKHFFEFGPLSLDTANLLLLKNNEVVPLKRKAVETLRLLVERRGEIVGKQELMQSL